MWSYEKRLQFPVNIKEPNAKLAQVIISQYGGPDGDRSADKTRIEESLIIQGFGRKAICNNYGVCIQNPN